MSHWPLHVPQVVDILSTAELAEANRLSFWDAMIVTSAGVLGGTTVWSEDLNHGQQITGITIRNPFRD